MKKLFDFLKNKVKLLYDLIPDRDFFALFIKKWIGFCCSLKVVFFLTSTYLLVTKHITGGNWVTALGIILGARFGNQLMYEYKQLKHLVNDEENN